ncbi:MAG: DedA family protein [Deltaproteobacteria bacterium]|nr:DedA family protein [Deltaproteobacteria bacterium]
MNLILELLNFLEPYEHLAYIIMFLILLACGFGLPLPEDVILVTGGILASRDVTDFRTTVLVTMAGVLIGDGIIYMIGRKVGPHIKETKFFRFIMTEKRDERITYWFSRYHEKVIFFARFMPGLRMPLFLTAGIYRVPAWKFFALDGSAAIISVPLWIWVGYIFGENLEILEQKIRKLQFGIYGVLAGVLVLFFVIWLIKKNSRKFFESRPIKHKDDEDIHP